MKEWSTEENAIVVREYFLMLEQELAAQAYVKTRHIERVHAETKRSTKSVEFKFRNISAVLHGVHAPWVDGYKPARNFQSSLAEVVQTALQSRPKLLDLMRDNLSSSAAPRVDFTWDIVHPPRDLAFPMGRAFSLHTDFVMLEASNRSLGSSGEQLIVGRERELLRRAGREDLAERVEHVARTMGDGLGYDISSFEPDGRPRLIEVKTTRRGSGWPMYVTRNEVTVSRAEADHYVLARVFNFAKHKVGLFELLGAIEDTCILEPDTWRALPRSR